MCVCHSLSILLGPPLATTISLVALPTLPVMPATVTQGLMVFTLSEVLTYRCNMTSSAKD